MTENSDQVSFVGQVLKEREDLIELAKTLGVRPDWHEPDEQDLTASFGGVPGMFDNAMPTAMSFGDGKHTEMFVTLNRLGESDPETGERTIGEPIASVNLATLFAWAAQEADNSAEKDAEIARLQKQLRDIRNIAAGAKS